MKPAAPDAAFSDMQKSEEGATDVFAVESILYQAPQYSFANTPETAPRYRITPNLVLSSKGDVLMANENKKDWLVCGALSNTTLTRDNFDRCFASDEDAFWKDTRADTLRKQNQAAWRVRVSDSPNSVFYYLLRQDNGEVYLAYGYDGENNAPASIRWLFKLRADASPNAVNLVAGAAYVSGACLYMNPLSSYMPINGDSGERYVILENEFAVYNKSSDEIIGTASPVQWGWKPFPYSDEEWAALFFDSENTPAVSSQYSEMLYQPLPAPYSLFCMDGELWLAAIRENSNMGKFLWSIYRLVPDHETDSAVVTSENADAHKAIEQLFDTIMSSPAASSNPGDYIAAHPNEESALLRYGDDTLRYIFSAFLNGGQTGLKGHLMRIIMDALIGSEAIEMETENGQVYFDAWLAEARRTKAAQGGAMQETAPKAWLLMQMIENRAS